MESDGIQHTEESIAVGPSESELQHSINAPINGDVSERLLELVEEEVLKHSSTSPTDVKSKDILELDSKSEESESHQPKYGGSSVAAMENIMTPLDSEIVANASSISLPEDDASELRRLRDLVFASRGSKASLPSGWDDSKPEEKAIVAGSSEDVPVNIIGNTTKDAAQKMLQRAIDLVGQLASESDTDSSSDSDCESDASSSTTSHSPASTLDKKGKKKLIKTETLSDDEDEGGGGKVGAMGPVTKNEVLEPTVDVPPYSVVPVEREIRPLGKIHSIVDCVVVVAQDVGAAPGSKQSSNGIAMTRPAPLDMHGRKGEEEGEYSVLDTGSLLAFEDRNVLGVVFETFGSVLSPLYALRYTSATHVNTDLIRIGKPVYYVPGHSTYVLTRSLRALGKGSDASNLWDEEIDDDERDFSDDEAEASYKRNAKASKGRGKKRGNTEEQSARLKHHLPVRPPMPTNGNLHRDASITQQHQMLSYDEDENDHCAPVRPYLCHQQQPWAPQQQLQSDPAQSAYAQWLHQQQQQRQQLSSGSANVNFHAYPAHLLFSPTNDGANGESYDPQQPHFAFPSQRPPPRWQ